MIRVLTRCGAALVAVVAFAAPGTAASLDDYRARVAEATLVARALAATEERPTEIGVELAVERLRSLLPADESVEFEGVSYPVDNAWLGRTLDAYVEASVEERELVAGAIVSRLDAVTLHLDALASGEGRVDAEASRERLASILARDDFKEAQEDAVTRWARTVREAILRFLRWLQDLLFGGASGSAVGTGVRVLIVVIGGVAFFLLLKVLVERFRERGVRTARETARTVLGETIEAGMTAAQLADQARRLAAQGEHRGAIRKLFVALLYDLDERKLIRLEPDLTNREYLARVRALGRLYPVMASMTDTFERVWYGGAVAGAGEFAAFEAQFAEASRAASERVGATT